MVWILFPEMALDAGPEIWHMPFEIGIKKRQTGYVEDPLCPYIDPTIPYSKLGFQFQKSPWKTVPQ